MANLRISELQSAPTISGSYIFPASSEVNTYKISFDQLSSWINYRTVNDQYLTQYEVSSSDNRSILVFHNDNTVTVTIPHTANTGLPIGTSIELVRLGNGRINVTSESGVSINSSIGWTLRTVYSRATLNKIGNSAWILSGDLALSPTPTASLTPTISVTPTYSRTPTATPTISLTSSQTPTPTVTPSVSTTPGLTPTPTPSSAPNSDAFANDVSLLLHLENNTTDNSLSPKTCSLVNVGTDGAIFSTDAAKFGTYGVRFDGSQVSGSEAENNQEYSRLTMTGTGLTSLPSNWTFEMWFKPSTTWSSNSNKYLLSGGDRYYSFIDLYHQASSLKFNLSYFDWNTSENTTGSLNYSVGSLSSEWHHIAISRSSDTIKIFLDGTQVGSSVTLSGGDTTASLGIGNFAIASRYDASAMSWYDGTSIDIDEIRITNAARYSSNFTVPSLPFPNP